MEFMSTIIQIYQILLFCHRMTVVNHSLMTLLGMKLYHLRIWDHIHEKIKLTKDLLSTNRLSLGRESVECLWAAYCKVLFVLGTGVFQHRRYLVLWKECLMEGHPVPRQQIFKAFLLRNCLCQYSFWLIRTFHINGITQNNCDNHHHNTFFLKIKW